MLYIFVIIAIPICAYAFYQLVPIVWERLVECVSALYAKPFRGIDRVAKKWGEKR